MTKPLRSDWDVLGLEPGAEIAQIKTAYRYRRALYDRDSLATYTLIDDQERARMVERIDGAYRRITGSDPPIADGVAVPGSRPMTPPTALPTGPPPDRQAEPGAHLRHQRLTQGLSLQQIASETKVRASLLEQVEAEVFDKLPAPVFVRGYVLQFARTLGLDRPEDLTEAYLSKMITELRE